MGLSKISGSGIDDNVIVPANLHSSFVLPISKLATAGGVTFNTLVQCGGDPNDGSAVGAKMLQSGVIQAARASGSGTSAVYMGFLQGTSTATSRINANGSATFSGQGTFSGDLRVQDGGNFRVRNASNATQDAILLQNNGNITAAGGATFGSAVNGLYFSTDRTNGSSTVLEGYLNGTKNVDVKANGSVTFGNTITSGSSTVRGQFLGNCPSSITASAADAFVANYNGTTVARVRYDGSATFNTGSTFAGICGGSAGIYVGDSTTTNQGNAKARINSDGSITTAKYIVSTRFTVNGALSSNVNGINYPFAAYDGSSNLYASITEAGNATFAGTLTVSENINGLKAISASGTTTTPVVRTYSDTLAAYTASLNADGSASFGGGSFAIESDGDISTNIRSHGNIELDSSGAFTSPKIKLFAATGAASFKGLVTTGDSSLNASSGIWARNNATSVSGGTVYATNFATSGTPTVFVGANNLGTETSYIYSSGAATFAGEGKFGSTVIAKGGTSGANVFLGLQESPSGSFDPANANATITAGGTANFASSVFVGGSNSDLVASSKNVSYVGAGPIVSNRSSSSSTAMSIRLNGADKTLFKSDGKIILATGSPGIQFGSSDTGTNITSQTLDDYEEGTWTPSVLQGVTNISYAHQQGIYTKIGNILYYYLHIELNGGTPNASTMIISGLPYTSFWGGSLTHYTASTYYLNAGAAYGNDLKALVFPNTSVIYMYLQGTTGVTQLAGNGLVKTSGSNRFQILLSGFYRVA